MSLLGRDEDENLRIGIVGHTPESRSLVAGWLLAAESCLSAPSWGARGGDAFQIEENTTKSQRWSLMEVLTLTLTLTLT